MQYELTDADRALLPPTYTSEPRYLGYREADRAKPYAAFFQDRTLPIQDHAREAMIRGPVPAEHGLRLSEAVAAMTRSGYLPCETGYTVNADGLVVVSVSTDMPGVTGEMWDWWFAWHGAETAPYKLWHPDAHLYSSMGQDRTAIPGLSDRQRYVGNVSYVDEYLGAEATPLTVRFIDQERFGFAAPRAGETVIVARGGLSTMPVSFAWLIHQVRATPGGAEMRSRFFVNDVSLLPLPAHAVCSTAGQAMTNQIVQGAAGPIVKQVAKRKLREFGPDMLFHYASEMNHLASFLPKLHAEFGDR